MSGVDEATVAALSHWASIESPTHDRAGVNAMMDLVAGEAAEAGLGCERIAGGTGSAI